MSPTLYNPPDVRWYVLIGILSSYYVCYHHILGLNGVPSNGNKDIGDPFWQPETAPITTKPHGIDAKSALMQALAEVEEDEWQDDGEIEIPSDEEYTSA